MEKALEAQFGAYLAQHGFSSKARYAIFSRSTNIGGHRVRVPMMRSNDDGFIVNMYFEVRVDRVEDVYVPFLPFIRDEARRKLFHINVDEEHFRSATLAVAVENLERKVKTGWIFYEEEDVPVIVGMLSEIFERLGIGYFARYKDMESVLETLMDESWYGSINRGSVLAQCQAGITLARLLGKDASYLEELSEDYRSKITRANQKVQEFDDYLLYLETAS